MKAGFVGKGPPSGLVSPAWSDRANWAGGQVPTSSSGLRIELDVPYNPSVRAETLSLQNLGTAQQPFVTGDVISSHLGIAGFEDIGFLSARDITNADVWVIGSVGAGHLLVRHDANADFGFYGSGGTLEIGHALGASTFNFDGDSLMFPYGGSPANATLVIDRPPGASLRNDISFNRGFHGDIGNGKVELGGLVFDQADATPNPSGDFTVKLTEHGAPVYQLDHVGLAGYGSPGAPTLSVGVDQTTGFHYVAYSNA